MADAFRVGIIGAVSSYSLHYARAFVEMDGVEFVGMAHLGRSASYIRDALNLPWLASYPKTVEGYEERFGGGVYESADDLLGEGRPDAVCICTEAYLHLHYTLKAVDAGAHAFVPKPFARSREEADAMFGAAAAKGVVVVGNLAHRHRPASVAVSEAIAEGAIGRPVSGHFSITHHLTLGGWKSDTTMAAGPEYEMGYYVFDLLRMTMGSEPKKVMGLGANLDHHGIPYIDNGKCLVECENGALASVGLLMSMHHPYPPGSGMHVVGDAGGITLERDSSTGTESVVVHTPDGVDRRPVGDWRGDERELAAWIDCCRRGDDVAWWQDECLRTLDLISAYKRAYETGETVFLGDPGDGAAS